MQMSFCGWFRRGRNPGAVHLSREISSGVNAQGDPSLRGILVL